MMETRTSSATTVSSRAGSTRSRGSPSHDRPRGAQAPEHHALLGPEIHPWSRSRGSRSAACPKPLRSRAADPARRRARSRRLVRKRISIKKGGPEARDRRPPRGASACAHRDHDAGHAETDAELTSICYVRDLQTRPGSPPVPWSYSGNTPMESKVKHGRRTRYFRVLAVARISTTSTTFRRRGSAKVRRRRSRHFGADDFGGTLYEENVHLATGHVNKTGGRGQTPIREALHPAQRTTLYDRPVRGPRPWTACLPTSRSSSRAFASFPPSTRNDWKARMPPRRW